VAQAIVNNSATGAKSIKKYRTPEGLLEHQQVDILTVQWSFRRRERGLESLLKQIRY
jgi:hypothetical protein